MKTISEEGIKNCCSKAIDERREFIESCEETNQTIRSFLEMDRSIEYKKLNSRSIKALHATLNVNICLIKALRDDIDYLTTNASL